MRFCIIPYSGQARVVSSVTRHKRSSEVVLPQQYSVLLYSPRLLIGNNQVNTLIIVKYIYIYKVIGIHQIYFPLFQPPFSINSLFNQVISLYTKLEYQSNSIQWIILTRITKKISSKWMMSLSTTDIAKLPMIRYCINVHTATRT